MESLLQEGPSAPMMKYSIVSRGLKVDVLVQSGAAMDVCCCCFSGSLCHVHCKMVSVLDVNSCVRVCSCDVSSLCSICEDAIIAEEHNRRT